jgi:hypothetical protein
LLLLFERSHHKMVVPQRQRLRRRRPTTARRRLLHLLAFSIRRRRETTITTTTTIEQVVSSPFLLLSFVCSFAMEMEREAGYRPVIGSDDDANTRISPTRIQLLASFFRLPLLIRARMRTLKESHSYASMSRSTHTNVRASFIQDYIFSKNCIT